jgi:hypothetical protein
VSVLGSAAGVLHATAPGATGLEPEAVETLQLLGAGLGSRLGMVRALSESAVAAATDPRTGLAFRRFVGSVLVLMINRVCAVCSSAFPSRLSSFGRQRDWAPYGLLASPRRDPMPRHGRTPMPQYLTRDGRAATSHGGVRRRSDVVRGRSSELPKALGTPPGVSASYHAGRRRTVKLVMSHA